MSEYKYRVIESHGVCASTRQPSIHRVIKECQTFREARIASLEAVHRGIHALIVDHTGESVTEFDVAD